MAEYIEREAAVDFAQHAYNEWNLAMDAAEGQQEINLVYKRQELCKAVKSVFSDMPAADVAPVVHGRWENNKDEYPECTNCRYMPAYDSALDDIYYSPYCPNCGAKMDGGEKANE